MSAAERLTGGNTGDVNTPHQDMLASIERTGFYSSSRPWIPLVAPDVLAAGDRTVLQSTDSQDIRRVTIVGHDAVKFEGEHATVLPNYRTAELLGLLVLERQLLPPKHYIARGFFPQAATPESRPSVFAQAAKKLQTAVQDSRGLPLVKRTILPERPLIGITDALITDIRHTVPYKEARRRSAYHLFEEYLKSGGQMPGLLEQPTIEGARMALRSLAGSGMNQEQQERFLQLSEETAAMLTHKTDLYDQQYPLTSRLGVANARRRIIDEFDPQWQQGAACGIESEQLFFPPANSQERKWEKIAREEKAKALCRSCPVQVDCLEYALSRQEKHGVWGGLNERERTALLRRRAERSDR